MGLMGLCMSDSSDAGSAPKKQRIVMTLEGKVELLDMYHRLRFAAVVSCHFRTNESTIRTAVKRKKEKKEKEEGICEAFVQPHQKAQQHCAFCEILFCVSY